MLVTLIWIRLLFTFYCRYATALTCASLFSLLQHPIISVISGVVNQTSHILPCFTWLRKKWACRIFSAWESGAPYSSLNVSLHCLSELSKPACSYYPSEAAAAAAVRLVKAIQATLPTSLICLLITHEWGPASEKKEKAKKKAGELRYNQCFPPPFMRLPLVHCTQCLPVKHNMSKSNLALHHRFLAEWQSHKNLDWQQNTADIKSVIIASLIGRNLRQLHWIPLSFKTLSL